LEHMNLIVLGSRFLRVVVVVSKVDLVLRIREGEMDADVRMLVVVGLIGVVVLRTSVLIGMA
jgi:hypothetical protein